MQEPMEKRNKVVLVTGGSSGIGAATVRRLSAAGMTVYAASRSGKMPEGVSGAVIPLVLDVNDSEALAAAVRRIVSEQGRLDALVSNAGNGLAGSVEDMSGEEIRAQYETTFFGSVKAVKACLPVFRKQGAGRIVTVGSIASVVPLPFQGFYSCAKSSVLMLTRALALETRPFGIQCACILPGDVRTGFTKARRYAAATEGSVYEARARKSLAKMERDERTGMPPEKIARAVFRQLTCRRMRPVVVPGLVYKVLWCLIKFLPERLVLRVLGRLYG